MTETAVGTRRTGVWIAALPCTANLQVSAQANAIASASVCVGGRRHHGEESASGVSDDGACDYASRVVSVQREAGVALWILQVSSLGAA